MAHKTLLTGGAILTALVATIGIAFCSFAYAGDNNLTPSQSPGNVNQPAIDPSLEKIPRPPDGFTPKNKEAVLQAMANLDFNAWKEAMGDSPITEKITQDNFAKFVEMRQLIKDGKFAEAKVISEELGVRFPGKHGRFGGRMKDANGDGYCDQADRQAEQNQ